MTEPVTGIRLNKRMAELGLCSRRQADDWIARGWVRVDGAVATLGQSVTPQSRITVQQQARAEQTRQVTVLLNKPLGLVSGQAEDGHTPARALIVPEHHWREDRSTQRWEAGQLRHLVPAGRLDVDSTGLLVLTQDGRVTRALIGEDRVVEKEYLVRVAYHGKPSSEAGDGAQATYGARRRLTLAPPPDAAAPQDLLPAEQLQRLRHGLALDGEPLKPAQVDWINPQQLRFVLTQGKKRQIRRMCELVGLTVLGLKRVRIGQINLGALPLGQWRYLGEHERF